MNKDRDDHAAQLRSLRTQLANTALERHQHDNSNTQLEQLLADSRRENTLLKDEVYSLKATVGRLQEERVSHRIIAFHYLTFITGAASIVVGCRPFLQFT